MHMRSEYSRLDKLYAIWGWNLLEGFSVISSVGQWTANLASFERQNFLLSKVVRFWRLKEVLPYVKHWLLCSEKQYYLPEYKYQLTKYLFLTALRCVDIQWKLKDMTGSFPDLSKIYLMRPYFDKKRGRVLRVNESNFLNELPFQRNI